MVLAVFTHNTKNIDGKMYDIGQRIDGNAVTRASLPFYEFIPDVWVISLDQQEDLNNTLQKLKTEITWMKKNHPSSKIFLLRQQEADDSEDCKAKLQQLEVHKQFILKKKQKKDIKDFNSEDWEASFEYFEKDSWAAFLNELSLCSFRNALSVKKWFETEGNKDPMEAALTALSKESFLRASLERLQREMLKLESGLVYSQLAEASLKLVNGLNALGPNDNAAELIEEYQRSCHNYLQEGTSSTAMDIVAGIVAVVIAAAVVMTIVLSAGYFLGWAFGAWACTEMFVAQWVAGGLAAGIVAKATETAGAAMFALGLYGLFTGDFPRAQVGEALDNVVEVSKDIQQFAS